MCISARTARSTPLHNFPTRQFLPCDHGCILLATRIDKRSKARQRWQLHARRRSPHFLAQAVQERRASWAPSSRAVSVALVISGGLPKGDETSVRINLQNPIDPSMNAPVSCRAVTRTDVIAPEAFSRSLATASRSLARSSANASATVSRSSAVSRILQTTQQGAKTRVVTPFGVIEHTTPAETSRTQTTYQPNGWRDYFRTHQPAEWWKDPDTRKIFAQIYGDKALVTLDWTCTVPENTQSVWVTHVPVDASGRPFPKVWNS